MSELEVDLRRNVGWRLESRNPEFESFLWAGEVLSIDKLGYGFRIEISGSEAYVFDELYEALDWWSERIGCEVGLEC